MDIPAGAQFFNVTYGSLAFYKYDFDFIGVESGETYNCWHWWNGREWKKEVGFRKVGLRPISEYEEGIECA